LIFHSIRRGIHREEGGESQNRVLGIEFGEVGEGQKEGGLAVMKARYPTQRAHEYHHKEEEKEITTPERRKSSREEGKNGVRKTGNRKSFSVSNAVAKKETFLTLGNIGEGGRKHQRKKKKKKKKKKKHHHPKTKGRTGEGHMKHTRAKKQTGCDKN